MQFEKIAESDDRLINLHNIPAPYKACSNPKNCGTRASIAASEWCALSSVSFGALGVAFALIIVASIMKWSETTQLLCNTPTMIIEGFLLLILIQAHNIANTARSAYFKSLLKHRLLLIINHYVCELSKDFLEAPPYNEKSAAIAILYPVEEDDHMKRPAHQVEDCV